VCSTFCRNLPSKKVVKETYFAITETEGMLKAVEAKLGEGLEAGGKDITNGSEEGDGPSEEHEMLEEAKNLIELHSAWRNGKAEAKAEEAAVASAKAAHDAAGMELAAGGGGAAAAAATPVAGGVVGRQNSRTKTPTAHVASTSEALANRFNADAIKSKQVAEAIKSKESRKDRLQQQELDQQRLDNEERRRREAVETAKLEREFDQQRLDNEARRRREAVDTAKLEREERQQEVQMAAAGPAGPTPEEAIEAKIEKLAKVAEMLRKSANPAMVSKLKVVEAKMNELVDEQLSLMMN